jgi:hypothetical protein
VKPGVRYVGHADEHYIEMLHQCQCYGLTGGHNSATVNDATRDLQYTYVEWGAAEERGMSCFSLMANNLGFVRSTTSFSKTKQRLLGEDR